MSNIRRDEEKSFSRNNIRESDIDYHRKRTNIQQTLNNDAKVYVGNVPTENLTDGELLHFFKPFGKISDIRVYKGYLFVQYERIDDARRLIQQGETCLILKGNKLDILPAMDASSNYSPTERSYQDYKSCERESSRNSRRHSDDDRNSSNYQPPRKRYPPKHHHMDSQRQRDHFPRKNYPESNVMEIDDDRDIPFVSSSQKSSDRLIRSPKDHQSSYRILTGSDHPKDLIHCRIIIVNPRQRGYAEQISSHLRCHGLITSIILLREDYTLIEAIQNASDDHCLYGIIAMPMHEERHTASFHILHGQTEEHRNLTLEDGYHIILTNFSAYQDRIQNEETNNQSKEIFRQEELINSTIKLGDKFPLSMLLCLLADGRQLTLDEIDRVLFYLLEKKSKMLTLPQGTLPPLPAQYANYISTTNHSSSLSSSTIAEQIRQILSSNSIKSSSLTSTNEQMSERIQIESQSKVNLNEIEKDSNQYQQKIQPSFSYSKSNSNSVAVVAPSFHYSSIPTNGNSSLKESTTISPFGSEYIYPTLTNSSAADTAAAIFQAYSQFNARTTPTIPILNQHIPK